MARIKRYLKNVLEPREHIVCMGGLHWIYLTNGIVWFVMLAALGWGADALLWYYFGQYVATSSDGIVFNAIRQNGIAWLFTACGVVILATQFLRYLTTEVIVTSLRVISKTGLLNIRMNGTDISDIRGVHVDQGWLGRFLNYGKIRLDCRFIEDVNIPHVKDPYKFTRNMQRMKSEIEGHDFDASQNKDHVVNQTIIQLHGGAHEISQQDAHTLIVKPADAPPEISPTRAQLEDHRLHDEIIDDFKTKA